MSFDDSYGLAILFGGALSSGPANDTWHWDGSSWAQVSTSSAPSPRYAVELAYDEAHQVSVLFSGDPGFLSYPSDTWTYSPGSGWNQANVAGPTGRRSYALAYDSARQSTILYGGWGGGSTTSNFFPETWEWDGGSMGWVQRASTGPPGLFRPAMAFDDATGEMILYGGAVNAVNTCAAAQTGTWGWDGTSGAWTQKSPVHSPPPLAGHTMVYDSRRQKIVMFGGCTTTEFSDQVWEWDGADWTQVMLSGPSARWLHGMVFSTSSEMSVLFGGSNGAVSLGDTWNYWGP